MPNLREHGISQNLPSKGFGDEEFYTFDSSISVGDTVSLEGETVPYATEEICTIYPSANSQTRNLATLIMNDDYLIDYHFDGTAPSSLRLTLINIKTGVLHHNLNVFATANIQSAEMYKVNENTFLLINPFYIVNVWKLKVLLIKFENNLLSIVQERIFSVDNQTAIQGNTSFLNGVLYLSAKGTNIIESIAVTPTSLTLLSAQTLTLGTMTNQQVIKQMTSNNHLIVIGRLNSTTYDMGIQVWKLNGVSFELKIDVTPLGNLNNSSTSGNAGIINFITPCGTGFLLDHMYYNGSTYNNQLGYFEINFSTYTIYDEIAPYGFVYASGVSAQYETRLLWSDGEGTVICSTKDREFIYSLTLKPGSHGVTNETTLLHSIKYNTNAFITYPCIYKGKIYFFTLPTYNSTYLYILMRKDINMTNGMVSAVNMGLNRSIYDIKMFNEDTGIVTMTSHLNMYYVRAFKLNSDGTITFGSELSIAHPCVANTGSIAVTTVQKDDPLFHYFVLAIRDTTSNTTYTYVCKARKTDLNITIGSSVVGLPSYVLNMFTSPIRANKYLLLVPQYGSASRVHTITNLYVIDFDFDAMNFTIPTTLSIPGANKSNFRIAKIDDYTHSIVYLDSTSTLSYYYLGVFINSVTLAITTASVLGVGTISGVSMLDLVTPTKVLVTYFSTNHLTMEVNYARISPTTFFETGRVTYEKERAGVGYTNAYASFRKRMFFGGSVTAGNGVTRYAFLVQDNDLDKEVFYKIMPYNINKTIDNMTNDQSRFVEIKDFVLQPLNVSTQGTHKYYASIHVMKPGYTVKKGGKRPFGMVTKVAGNGRKVTVRKFI